MRVYAFVDAACRKTQQLIPEAGSTSACVVRSCNKVLYCASVGLSYIVT